MDKNRPVEGLRRRVLFNPSSTPSTETSPEGVHAMDFDFLNWFRALNPVGRVSLTLLAISLAVLVLIGIGFSIRAIVKAVRKGSKAAAKGLIDGLEKAHAKVEAAKPKVEASLHEAKLKITSAFATVKEKLDEVFHGKPSVPTGPLAPVAPEVSPAPVPTVAKNPDDVVGASAPGEAKSLAPDASFEFSEEQPPQYCAHCGMQFTQTMIQRVSHSLPAFCGCCGMKFTPTSGPSYQKLVDEVLQP